MYQKGVWLGMNTKKSVFSVMLALAMMLALSAALTACNQDEPIAEELPQEEVLENVIEPEPVALTELAIEDTVVGEGPEVSVGDTIIIDWAGYYIDGMLFNSSAMVGEPYIFTVGEGTVIEGWDVGVLGMQLGGERTLLIPSDMAFGEEGAHPMVSANQDLRFEITLLEIE